MTPSKTARDHWKLVRAIAKALGCTPAHIRKTGLYPKLRDAGIAHAVSRNDPRAVARARELMAASTPGIASHPAPELPDRVMSAIADGIIADLTAVLKKWTRQRKAMERKGVNDA